jgi:hypothetical protein
MEQAKLLKWHNEEARVLKYMGWTDYKDKKDFSLTLDKPTRNNIRQAFVYEVPVEIRPHKNTENVLVQVDLF